MLGSPIRALPRLTINLLAAASMPDRQVSIQDVWIIPMSTPGVDEGLVAAADVYRAAADLVFKKYEMRLLTRG